MPKLKPLGNKTGTNVSIIDKDDYFLLKIMKTKETKTSNTGRSEILASSDGWLSFDNFSGEDLKNKEVGINITITTRNKKKAKKRMDDDDG